MASVLLANEISPMPSLSLSILRTCVFFFLFEIVVEMLIESVWLGVQVGDPCWILQEVMRTVECKSAARGVVVAEARSGLVDEDVSLRLMSWVFDDSDVVF